MSIGQTGSPGPKVPRESQQSLGSLIDKHIDKKADQRVEQVTDKEFARRSAEVFHYLNDQLWQRDRDLDEDTQLALARSICLLMDISTTDILWLRRDRRLLDAVHESIKAILRDSPQLHYAESIHENVQRRLHPRWGTGLYESFRRSMKLSPAAVVVCGLFVMLFILLVFVPLLFNYFGFKLDAVTVGNLFELEPKALILIGIVGALGSIVSIMVRIRRDFAAYTRSTDPWPFFFFALFKPIVGAVFALFVFAAIRASILPLNAPAEDGEGWFIIAMAFIAGFSERFAGDVVSSTEQRIGGPSSGEGEGADATGPEHHQQEQRDGVVPDGMEGQNGKQATQ